MPYEYYLGYFGQVKRWVEHDLAIKETDFWFPTEKERDEFKAKLKSVSDAHNAIIEFKEYEGIDARKSTIARMIFTLPDWRIFPITYNFGYGYEPYDAEYVFEDGNYSCDCNRSIFIGLSDISDDGNCGDSIVMSEFTAQKEDFSGPLGVIHSESKS